MKNKYPILSLLIFHIKIGDATQWCDELPKETLDLMEKELEMLSRNAINPDPANKKNRMLFFEIASFFVPVTEDYLVSSADELMSAVEED